MLGYTGFANLTIRIICEKQLAVELPNRIKSEDVKCQICLENRIVHLKFKNDRSRARDVMEIVHFDIHGSLTPTGYKGQRFFL